MDGFYEWLKLKMGTDYPATVIVTNLCFLATLYLIWSLSARLPSASAAPGAVWKNRLVALIGALCGWVIGTGFAPYTDVERGKFEAIGSAASLFLSGYAVSKIDRFVEKALFQERPDSRDQWERMGLFMAAFLVTGLTVFLNRFYAFTG